MTTTQPAPPVGHLTRHATGLRGQRGAYYTYITASNGVWVEAEGPLLAARIPVAVGEIRGLAPDEPKIIMRHGKIPEGLWNKALANLMASVSTELFLAITWESGEYKMVRPAQDRSSARVEYKLVDNTILDMHSHHQMPAFFSGTDDADEVGFQLYCVIGRLHSPTRQPQLQLRVGIYGHRWPIPWTDIFEGDISEFDDLGAPPPDDVAILDFDVDPHGESVGKKSSKGFLGNVRARVEAMGLKLP